MEALAELMRRFAGVYSPAILAEVMLGEATAACNADALPTQDGSAILWRMPIGLPEIVRCPPELRAEALALVLCDLAPSQRREIARRLAGC